MGTLLHVDGHGEAGSAGPHRKGVERPATEIVVEPHAQLGQLHRDVGVEALGGDAVEAGEVVVTRRLCRGAVRDVLPEMVEGDGHTRLDEPPNRGDGIVQRLARHEPQSHPAAHPGLGEEPPHPPPPGDGQHEADDQRLHGGECTGRPCPADEPDALGRQTALAIATNCRSTT
jgi:hypothetical protein